MRIKFQGKHLEPQGQEDKAFKEYEYEVDRYKVVPPGEIRHICGVRCKTDVWLIEIGPCCVNTELKPGTLQVLKDKQWEYVA